MVFRSHIMAMHVDRTVRLQIWTAIILAAAWTLSARPVLAADARKLSFEGVLADARLTLNDLAALSPAGSTTDFPTDWTGYTHLVMEMRTSTPQRFGLWVHTADGARRIEIQPFGQNAWFRACVPLEYLRGSVSGVDLAASTNRRTDAFWMSVWGPWGELKNVEAISFSMDYPINHAAIELRNVHLAKQDEKSQFLETGPNGQMVDQFGQWALADWPRKIHSQAQLTAELADEASHFGTPADFGYGRYYGYAATQTKATGFFRVEQQNGKWWFVDPDGHLFLSTGIDGAPGNGGGGRGGRGGPGRGGARGAPGIAPATLPALAGRAPATAPAPTANLNGRRLDSWGMTTGGPGRAYSTNFSVRSGTSWMSLPDVYSDAFAAAVDAAASQQCTPLRNDPLLLGYFMGGEPPWGGRESEVCAMILAAPPTATQAKLKDFLATEDSPRRRRQFVLAAFGKFLELTCGAVRKYDPNHLILGIRYGGNPSEEVLRMSHIFDVCSINVYEYEPTVQVQRTYRLSDRPVMIGEFHIGVPENGQGAGLVQAMNQKERGNAYQYFMEQGASLDGFLGAWWFQWSDEPVMGRFDGENYNIGFIDSTNRAYADLVESAKLTNKRLFDVHSGKVPPLSVRPKASDLGTPGSPWDLDVFHGG